MKRSSRKSVVKKVVKKDKKPEATRIGFYINESKKELIFKSGNVKERMLVSDFIKKEGLPDTLITILKAKMDMGSKDVTTKELARLTGQSEEIIDLTMQGLIEKEMVDKKEKEPAR